MTATHLAKLAPIPLVPAETTSLQTPMDLETLIHMAPTPRSPQALVLTLTPQIPMDLETTSLQTPTDQATPIPLAPTPTPRSPPAMVETPTPQTPMDPVIRTLIHMAPTPTPAKATKVARVTALQAGCWRKLAAF